MDKKISICAVIPAAGKGSRLGLDVPKILVPITDKLTVLDILVSKLQQLVSDIVLIVSPAAQQAVQSHIKKKGYEVEVAIQKTPIGMGDAIFCGYNIWKEYDNILIVWGDQISLSEGSIADTIDAQTNASEPSLTLPIVVRDNLYVEYLFDANGRLQKVLHKREGDTLSAKGASDVGMFAMSTARLKDEWSRYLVNIEFGKLTKEINFLPFLAHLSQGRWKTHRVDIKDPVEARGLNNPDDLKFFKEWFSKL